MNPLKNKRQPSGTTLGLAIGLAITLTLLGVLFFYLIRLIGGSKQNDNACDAGVLNAGQQMLTVSISSTQVSQLPVLFQSLGINLNTGKISGLTQDSSGNYVADTTNATFGLLAYNAAAGAAAVIAQNATEESTKLSIANANAAITALNSYGAEVTTALQNSAAQAVAVTNLADLNSVNLLGKSITASFVADTSSAAAPNGLDYTFKPGTTNIYFGSYAANDSAFNTLMQQGSSGKDANGNYLLNGYTPLNIGTTAQALSAIYFASVSNPTTHLTTPGSPSITGNTAPPNTVTGMTQATTNLVVTNNAAIRAIATAIAGSNVQLAASLPTGYIKIYNYPDAILANQAPAAPNNNSALTSTIYGLTSLDSILNTEYWTGAGGKGGINMANYHASTGQLDLISMGDAFNGVFGTEDFEGTDGSTAPVVMGAKGESSSYGGAYSGSAEIQAWINYCNTTGSDANNHDPNWNPAGPTASHKLPYVTPSKNLRAGATYEEGAQLNDLLRLKDCSIVNCNTYSPGLGTNSVASDPSYANLTIFNSNYYGTWNYTSERDGQTMDTGTNHSTGGLTNLEYLKAEVIQAWINASTGYANTVNASSNTIAAANTATFTATSYTPTMPAYPSGVRVYDRSNETGFAAPSNTNGLTAFGTVATPYDLINKQIYGPSTDSTDYGQNSCANISDTSSTGPWNSVTTPLGALLQRCQEIWPNVQASDLITLLQQNTLDLNQTLYIYLPSGGSKLTISASAPPWVGTQSSPDGQPLASCSNAPWSSVIGNAVNATIQAGGSTFDPGSVNKAGDCDLHYAPWATSKGTLSSQDSFVFTPSSGYNSTNGDNLLGVLNFNNSVSGSATFSNPN